MENRQSISRPTDLPYTSLKPQIPWQRLYQKRQRRHPKDFKSVYVSRVPWSKISNGPSTIDFRQIGAEMRGWSHELKESI